MNVKSNFRQTLNQLKGICNKYDSLSNDQKIICLDTLRKKNFSINTSLIDYHNVLLFLIAHPSDRTVLSLSESELERLTQKIKKLSKKDAKKLENSGLPYTKTVSTFSHDLLKWISTNKDIKLELDSIHKSKIPVREAIQFTLPSLEKEISSIGYNNSELFNALQLNKKDYLSFLISEFQKLNDQPFIKDYFFNALHLYVKLVSTNTKFSKAYSRIPVSSHYFHTTILKQFDQLALLNTKLPQPKKLSPKGFEEVVNVVKCSLTLLQRETDPVSYMDERSFRLYELERGISIAIYGMTANRQLPLESYVGYTLFKNGFPAAYGGGWVFGKRSLFGINIFEPYRGGESGYMMCQLLRVYRQAFGVDYFEVEPYQYGLGNPEGISSGAYWFYFRFGFRSLDPELKQLAEKEFEKISLQKGYRSEEEKLIRFTESNVALNMGKAIPITISEIRDKITIMITQKYKGNRVEAEEQVIKNFLQKAGTKMKFSKEQKKVLSEIAFFSEVMAYQSSKKTNIVLQLVSAKPVDLYKYQELLVSLLD
jgi:hypothetical protein